MRIIVKSPETHIVNSMAMFLHKLFGSALRLKCYDMQVRIQSSLEDKLSAVLILLGLGQCLFAVPLTAYDDSLLLLLLENASDVAVKEIMGRYETSFHGTSGHFVAAADRMRSGPGPHKPCFPHMAGWTARIRHLKTWRTIEFCSRGDDLIELS